VREIAADIAVSMIDRCSKKHRGPAHKGANLAVVPTIITLHNVASSERKHFSRLHHELREKVFRIARKLYAPQKDDTMATH